MSKDKQRANGSTQRTNGRGERPLLAADRQALAFSHYTRKGDDRRTLLPHLLARCRPLQTSNLPNCAIIFNFSIVTVPLSQRVAVYPSILGLRYPHLLLFLEHLCTHKSPSIRTTYHQQWPPQSTSMCRRRPGRPPGSSSYAQHQPAGQRSCEVESLMQRGSYANTCRYTYISPVILV